MRVGNRRTANPISVPSNVQGVDFGRLASRVLIVFGVLFLVASITLAVHSPVKSWIIGQDRYLVAGDVAPLPVATMNWMASLRISATPWPTTLPRPTATLVAGTIPFPTLSPSPSVTSGHASMGAPMSVLGDSSVPPFAPTTAALPSPTVTLAPVPASGSRPPPVRIRIPSLDINRSVIHLARESDGSTGAQTWDTKKLFRSGRKDQVGHSEGSAYPGEEGNMILVGHSYGSGYSGAFVRLARLKVGYKVHVINSAGERFTYEVKTINKVKWRPKNSGELAQHLSFLSSGGSEGLTLVSCSGANVEPFPERVYVVAEPVE